MNPVLQQTTHYHEMSWVATCKWILFFPSWKPSRKTRVPFTTGLSYIIFHCHEVLVWEEGIGRDTIGMVYISNVSLMSSGKYPYSMHDTTRPMTMLPLALQWNLLFRKFHRSSFRWLRIWILWKKIWHSKASFSVYIWSTSTIFLQSWPKMQ